MSPSARRSLLLVGGFAVSLLVSVPLGIVAGIREGSKSDHAIVMLTMLLFSIPLFVSCVLAIYVFSLKLGWFPAFGLPFDEGLGSVIHHMVLPWVTLGLALIAVQAATLRAGTADAIRTGVRADGGEPRAAAAPGHPPACSAQRPRPDGDACSACSCRTWWSAPCSSI